MKKQPVTLTVPTPCHENWQAMTPAEQGRFCGSCQKTVMDFTAKTDREVARYFEQQSMGASTGSTCGRFRPDQLHRPLHAERPDGFGTRLRTLGLLVPGLLLGSWAEAQTQRQLMGKVACPKPVQQDTLVEVKQVVMGMMAMPRPEITGDVAVAPPKPPVESPLLGDTVIVLEKINRVISGKVLDASTGEALIGANILIKGTQTGTVSDIDGNYELSIPTALENPLLEFSYTGFETFAGPIAEGQKTVEAKMKPSAMLGEICFMGVVGVRKDETLYRLAKQKAIQFFQPLRERRKERNLEQSIAKQQKLSTVPVPLPEPSQPESPEKPLPAAMPVEVFPNPFSRKLNIRFDSPAAERLNIRLTDMQGRTVLLQTYEAMKGPQVVALDDLGAANLPSGQYLLELSSYRL